MCIDYCFSWTPNSLPLNDFIEEFLNNWLDCFLYDPILAVRARVQLRWSVLGSCVVHESWVTVGEATPTFTCRPWRGKPCYRVQTQAGLWNCLGEWLDVHVPGEAAQPSGPMWAGISLHSFSGHVEGLFLQGLQCFPQAERPRSQLCTRKTSEAGGAHTCMCTGIIWRSCQNADSDSVGSGLGPEILHVRCWSAGLWTWGLWRYPTLGTMGHSVRKLITEAHSVCPTKVQIPKDPGPWSNSPRASCHREGEAGFSGLWWALWVAPSVGRERGLNSWRTKLFHSPKVALGQGETPTPQGREAQGLTVHGSRERIKVRTPDWKKGLKDQGSSRKEADVTKFSLSNK